MNLAVTRKYDLCQEVDLQSNMCTVFFVCFCFCPKGKGEHWHLFTCADYVAFLMIDRLASLPETLLVCILCSDRAVALPFSTSSPWAGFCALPLVAWDPYFNTLQHTIQNWLEHACHSQLTLMTLLPT